MVWFEKGIFNAGHPLGKNKKSKYTETFDNNGILLANF